METIENIDIAILTGGLGTRLKMRFPNLPKGLVPVLGKPFLAHILDRLTQFGVTRTVLCTGYLGEKIRATFGSKYANIELLYSHETTLIDTGGALRLALPFFCHDTVMVLNGDSLINADLSAYTSWFRQSDAQASLLVSKVSDTSRYGRVLLDSDDKIQTFSEKKRSDHSGWINAGVYLFKKSIIQSIEPNRPVSLEAETFPKLAGRGLSGFRTDSKLLDIGTPESLDSAECFILEEVK